MANQDDMRPLRSLLVGMFLLLGPLTIFLMVEIGILPNRADGDSGYERGSYIGGILASFISVITGLIFLFDAFKQRLKQRADSGETSLMISINSITISPLFAFTVIVALFIIGSLVIPMLMSP
ncbi:hypothetical protein SAMN06265222_1574 [Neorhodopirellula lusitana]|uniref:Uncharacterized protein n=2 Tax=Neorhodopirellula lusitana TaxID=445327 RepID=A0ABY1QTM1_9BACT|nr:hypothetical protein SAMN06265222_1574 [Neorhodopirellula lusitana]